MPRKKCRHWADGEVFSLDIPFNRTTPTDLANLRYVTWPHRISPYLVDFKVGQAFGERQAQDTQLRRDVAIKILPEIFTSDKERLPRFEREAQMLAALNPPHIEAIYGVEDV